MSNGILPLNDKTLKMLIQKHPEGNEPPQEVLLQRPVRPVHPIVYEDMDESLILKAAMLTKGGSETSGLDTDGWRKILTSSSFGTASSDMYKTFALFVKRLCLKEIKNAESLKSFIACGLIALDQQSGLRPIGVREVHRKIAGKAVMILLKKDVLQAAESLQLCGGQVAGSEAAIHAMHVFNDDKTKGILLTDAENTFNSINSKVMLYNFKFICPVIATIYRTVICVLLDCLSLVEENYYLKRAQHKVIQHQSVLMLSGYYRYFNFCSISFPLTNSTPKRLLLQMT